MEVFSLEGRIWPSFLAELLPARCLITGLVCWWSGWVKQWAISQVGYLVALLSMVMRQTPDGHWGAPCTPGRIKQERAAPRRGMASISRQWAHRPITAVLAPNGNPRALYEMRGVRWLIVAGFPEISGQAGGIPSLLQASQCSQNLARPLPHLFVTSNQPAKRTPCNGGCAIVRQTILSEKMCWCMTISVLTESGIFSGHALQLCCVVPDKRGAALPDERVRAVLPNSVTHWSYLWPPPKQLEAQMVRKRITPLTDPNCVAL
jgi:hypothetical protein